MFKLVWIGRQEEGAGGQLALKVDTSIYSDGDGKVDPKC